MSNTWWNETLNYAMEVAAKAHSDQVRKSTGEPYISHPYSVGMMLKTAGYSDEVVIAGILHDVVEDTDLTLNNVEYMFGKNVTNIISGCTEDKTKSWEERKKHTIEYLESAPLEVRAVILADKLHNISSLLSEYEKSGDAVWKSFNRGRDKQEWYYKSLVDVLSRHQNKLEKGMFNDFKEKVDKLFSQLSKGCRQEDEDKETLERMAELLYEQFSQLYRDTEEDVNNLKEKFVNKLEFEKLEEYEKERFRDWIREMKYNFK